MSIYRGPGGAGDATTDSSTEAAAAINAAAQAATSATNAESSATQAANSATAASSSASSASTSASTATTQANNAASSASSASVSALAASTSATNAAASASTATTQANNASTSATSASTSASTAQSAATLATSKATDASNAASVATTKASQASTSATNAATSETNAAASASSASTSASTATTQASNAATSATAAAASASTATTKASEASTSATNAATSATNAANSATSAGTSATNAANSASAASTSATNAASSATSAASSASAAAASYDSFDDRYLGSKSSAPTLDNDGNALLTGALYFDTTSNSMKVYNGTAWLDAYASLSGALLATNNLSDLNSVSTARTNLGLGTAATTAATDYATAAQGTKADTAYGWGNHASAGYLLSSTAASTYQPLDADLTSIAGLSGTSGLLKKTAANTWSLDTTSYVSDTSLATTLDAYVLADNALAYYAPQAAPTFTGNVTLSSGTANGVAYLNGSKVLTTGSALTFDGTNLSVSSGAISCTVANAVSSARFSGATGYLQVRGYADSTYGGELASFTFAGGWSPISMRGSYALFEVAGTEGMRLTSTGLGIGTSSPNNKLEVRNDASGVTVSSVRNYTNDAASGSQLMLYSGGNFGAYLTQYSGSYSGTDFGSSSAGSLVLRTDSYPTANKLKIGTGTSGGPVIFATSDTERMRIDSSGNVGIGTSSPSYKLHIEGQGFFENGIRLGNSYSAIDVETGAYGLFLSGAQGALNHLFIDSSGNAGIGTSSPAYKLDVQGDVRAYAFTDNNGFIGTSGGIHLLSLTRKDNNAKLAGYDCLVFYTNATTLSGGSERMRIDSSGNVFVGGTTALAGSREAVYGDTSNQGSGTYPATLELIDTRAYNSTSPQAGGGVAFGYKYTSGGNYALGPSIQGFKENSTDGNYAAGLKFSTRPNGSNPAEAMRIDSSGNLLFNSGYGSVATAYGCRAWVNFNGTGTVAIRASGNVSSITDNGTGDYTVNLTTAMSDANYCVQANTSGYNTNCQQNNTFNQTTTQFKLQTRDISGNYFSDPPFVTASVIR